MAPRPTPTSLPTFDSEARVDWRPIILGSFAWAGAWLGTQADATPSVGGAMAGLGLALIGWWRRSALTLAAAFIFLVSLSGAGVRVWSNVEGPVPDLVTQRAVVVIEAQLGAGRSVSSGPGGPVWLVPVELRRVDGRGSAWWSRGALMVGASGTRGAAWSDLAAGSIVRVAARLGPSENVAILGWVTPLGNPEVIANPSPIDAAVNGLHAGLKEAVAGLPAGPAALVPALVVGDTTAMTAELTTDFRVTGLTHLTAVSGANLTLLLAAVMWLAGRVGVLGWWRRGLAVLVVVGFVVLCRAEPSVLRAAAMGAVGLAALGWGGPRQGLRYLSWAVIGLVLIDPWLARSVGFVLSVLASAGIVGFAQRWSRALSRWLPVWLSEAVCVPLAAQLATQPVVSAISGQVSIVGLAANAVAAPMVGPATVLGFAATWASVIALPLARVLGWAAAGFAQVLCWIAAAGAALPGAWLDWPATPIGLAVLVTGCVIMMLAIPHVLVRPGLVGLLVLAMVVVYLRPLSPPGWPPSEWLVVACDVGQGDATVIRVGPGAAVVVDAGPDPRSIDRCLDQLGVTEVALLVFTHPHADHIAGVSGVFSGRSVREVLLPQVNTDAPGWRQVRDAAFGTPVALAAPGMVVAVGQARLEVLAEHAFVAPAVIQADSAEENDSSLVLRASVAGVRILLAGDLQELGQSSAVAAVADLSAEVLLVPHHGSAHQDLGFLAGVRAQVALISVGAHNDYGHPAPRTVEAVRSAGVPVYRTDFGGALAVSGSAGALVVTTQRAGP